VGGVLLFAMFVARSYCYMNSVFYRRLLELEYLGCSMQSFTMMVTWTQPVFMYLSGTCAVLLIYLCKEVIFMRTGNQIKKSGRKETAVELHELARVMFCESFSKKVQAQLKFWIYSNQLDNNLGDLDIGNKLEYLQAIYLYTTELCSGRDSFEDLFLMAQAEFMIKRNIFEAVRLLRVLRSRMSRSSFIRAILLVKLENDIKDYMQERFKIPKAPEYEEYLENIDFLELLLVGAKVYRQLWLPVT